MVEKEGNYASIQTMDNYDITGKAKTTNYASIQTMDNYDITGKAKT